MFNIPIQAQPSPKIVSLTFFPMLTIYEILFLPLTYLLHYMVAPEYSFMATFLPFNSTSKISSTDLKPFKPL